MREFISHIRAGVLTAIVLRASDRTTEDQGTQCTRQSLDTKLLDPHKMFKGQTGLHKALQDRIHVKSEEDVNNAEYHVDAVF